MIDLNDDEDTPAVAAFRRYALDLGFLIKPVGEQEDLADAGYIDQLNRLCDEFGCVAGEDRLVWLRDQLTELKELSKLRWRSPDEFKDGRFEPVQSRK